MFPTFAEEPSPRHAAAVLTQRQAAEVLGLHPKHVRKMVRAGMLPSADGAGGELVDAAAVRALAGRPPLVVVDGELTVLRTDAREPSRGRYPDDAREWMGFHVDFEDGDLAATSLRWWRSDPARVLENQLFAVTVGTFPVAVYLIPHDGHVGSFRRAGERFDRHHYRGELLARVDQGMRVRVSPGLPDWLAGPVGRVMASTITVDAGGPIGYLSPQPDGEMR